MAPCALAIPTKSAIFDLELRVLEEPVKISLTSPNKELVKVLLRVLNLEVDYIFLRFLYLVL